jgi:hypothetical protein
MLAYVIPNKPNGFSTYWTIFGLEYIPAGSLVSFALAFAATLDHPIHDRVHLALAETRNISPVTADGRFVNAARRAGLTPSQIISLSEAV